MATFGCMHPLVLSTMYPYPRREEAASRAFTAAELALIASEGAWISASPEVEQQMGLGAPPLRAMLDAGVDPTVSVDVVAAATGDLRTQVRMLLQTQRMLDHAANQPGPMLSWPGTLPYVTSHAAASLGLDQQIGVLAPGRKADVVLIRRSDPGVAPVSSATMAALTAPASAVDTVLVGGQILKQHGELAAGNLAWLRSSVEQARDRLLGL